MIRKIKNWIYRMLPKVMILEPMYFDNVKYMVPTSRLATLKEIIRKEYDIQR